VRRMTFRLYYNRLIGLRGVWGDFCSAFCGVNITLRKVLIFSFFLVIMCYKDERCRRYQNFVNRADYYQAVVIGLFSCSALRIKRKR